MSPLIKKLIAECTGTYILVFAGTGAIIINESGHDIIGHAGIAATFGLVVMAMIFTFGEISGAHFNPAVTIGFAAAKRFPWSEVPSYIFAQILGAILASFTLSILFPLSPILGATQPSGSIMQSFLLEIILTTILMLVILSVASGGKEKGTMAGIAIGSVIMLEAMFAGPISGASMNPARSIGPALVSLHFQHLWIYIIAPIIGALISIPLCKASQASDCCSGICAKTEIVS